MAALEILMPMDQDGHAEVQRHNNNNGVDLALRQGGQPVIMGANGQPTHMYQIEQYLGGWLLDGCPLNVVMGGPWQPAQILAACAGGIQPRCPQQAGPLDCGAPAAGGQPTPVTPNLPPPPGGYPPGAVAVATGGGCDPGFDLMGGGGYDRYCLPSGSAPVFRPTPSAVPASTVIQSTPTSPTAPGMPSSFAPSVTVGGSTFSTPSAPAPAAAPGGGVDLIQYWPLALAGVAILAGYSKRR